MVRIILALALAILVAGCSAGDGSADGSRPHVVVTTTILGDVVENLVGDAADVEVVMPSNADPHDFAPSAQQAVAMRGADVLVVNGLGFEEGLLDTVEAAEADGVPVITAADAIDPISLPTGDAADPHFFTDPSRMRDAAELIGDQLVDRIPALDTPVVRDRVRGYLDDLAALDVEAEGLLADIPAPARVLVTDHEVLGYFADRYHFEVLGAIVPGGSTLAEPSPSELADLAQEIEDRGVPAIFAEASSSTRLAAALAAEGSGVEVVELYGEALGPPGTPGDTYIGMIRTNAQRVAAALT